MRLFGGGPIRSLLGALGGIDAEPARDQALVTPQLSGGAGHSDRAARGQVLQALFPVAEQFRQD